MGYPAKTGDSDAVCRRGLITGKQKLSTPYGAIRSEPGSIEGDSQHHALWGKVVVCHAGGDMGMMVLDANAR